MDEEGRRRERLAFEAWAVITFTPSILGTRDCDLLWQGWREGRQTILRPVESFLEALNNHEGPIPAPVNFLRFLEQRGGIMPPFVMEFDLTKEKTDE